MIVQPDFADHWKTELLIRLCGTEAAVRCLLRFWSHCQNRRQWEFTNLTPEILASICRWQGEAQVFWDAMNQTFIDRTGDTHTAHEWSEINSQLTHNWEAGKKGGRPRKNPTETQGFSQGLPKGSCRGNPTETLGVTDREEKRREDEIEKKERSQPAKVVTLQESLEIILSRLPEEFSESEDFKDHWTGFYQHRVAMKSKLTERAVILFVKDLEEWGVDGSIKSIAETIKSGKWTGLFAPKQNGTPFTGNRITPKKSFNIPNL